MNYKISGLSSIILIFIAIGIADYQLFKFSLFLGIVYTICTPIVFLNLIYNYCRKCPHVKDDSCRHVIFGWIIKNLFKPVNSEKYKLKEIIIALIPFVLFIIFPQYWLFQSLSFFIIFWILFLIAALIVRTGVCSGCRNFNCSFCPNRINESGK